MILYFSGTGNSAYVAKRIGQGIGDEVMDIFDRLRNDDHTRLYSSEPWVIVTPTYAWRIPRIVTQWLQETELSGNPNIYFIMTCAGSIGNAGKYLEALCQERKLSYQGCKYVIMPENYIALFSTPAQAEANEIIEQAEVVIDTIIVELKQRSAFLQPAITTMDKVNSGMVNAFFYPVFVHAKKFYASDACISCGKCVSKCVEKNIHLEKGKPAWGRICTHCMACINTCPVGAIEYGKHTKGLVRYTCPRDIQMEKEEGRTI